MGKLYSLTEENFRLPFATANKGSLVFVDAENIPKMFWPDGSWNMPANLYMLKLFHGGYSRLTDGGTLTTYANQLGHIIRYVYLNGIELHKLTDNRFTAFIRSLRAEKMLNDKTVPRRNEDTIIAIGRRTLEFLSFVGVLYDGSSGVGPNEKIKAEKREIKVSQSTSSYGTVSTSIRHYWHHNSLPEPSGPKKRNAISTADIKRLKGVVSRISPNSHIKKRRYVMLLLLEITGGRRSEVCALTVRSVLAALKMDEPFLLMESIKQGGNKKSARMIPVTRVDLLFIAEYINSNRSIVIHNTCGKIKDHGYVLINHRSGQQLKPNTLTQEVRAFRIAAGIPGRAHPHMFRHRFITKLFVSFITSQEVLDKEDFRSRILNVEYYKRKILEFTGQKHVKSLDHYIDLAFDEYFDVERVNKKIRETLDLEAIKRALELLKLEVEGGIEPHDIQSRISEMLSQND